MSSTDPCAVQATGTGISEYCISSSNNAPATYDELVARVMLLESNLSGLTQMSKIGLTYGNLLQKVDDLCRSNNQLLGAVADLQAEVYRLSHCGNPIIISVSKTG